MGLGRFKLLVVGALLLSGNAFSREVSISPKSDALESAGYRLEYETLRPEGKISFFQKKQTGVSFIGLKSAPVSLRSIQSKIVRLEGEKKTLKYVTTPSGTIFGFKTKSGQLYFFSTRGGMLELSGAEKDMPEQWLNRVAIRGGKK